ncbi:hypothetical protein [Cryobacterium sp. GrIS_2_6]|uniref:hypothetical protein n=1 Tax=Cryobacterium sp. GrIS_2_6 TaxID=3162785 RepID=UPI002DFF1A27|nr:hypothetical protein [Cryobacterium psychrotolerans]
MKDNATQTPLFVDSVLDQKQALEDYRTMYAKLGELELLNLKNPSPQILEQMERVSHHLNKLSKRMGQGSKKPWRWPDDRPKSQSFMAIVSANVVSGIILSVVLYVAAAFFGYIKTPAGLHIYLIAIGILTGISGIFSLQYYLNLIRHKTHYPWVMSHMKLIIALWIIAIAAFIVSIGSLAVQIIRGY